MGRDPAQHPVDQRKFFAGQFYTGSAGAIAVINGGKTARYKIYRELRIFRR